MKQKQSLLNIQAMKKILMDLRSRLLELLTHKIALPIILATRKTSEFNYSMEQLLNLPQGSLGNELAVYLKKKGFRLIPGYVRHDCKHILLKYEMDEVGEGCMQFYFLGNRRYSFTVILSVVICLILMPEHFKKFIDEFKKGRRDRKFPDIDFNKLLFLNTDQIRNQLL
jgi:hypothetical protein